jgi:transcriptional regulator with PAS, ATPase and Fis domain
MSRNIIKRPDAPVTIFHGIVTVAPQMLELFELTRRVAETDTSVLIRGETGTGKELVARAVHQLSARREGPFEAINCATLTPELLASELFGHVRGAFTGAIRDRQGLFARADGGTVFLDEIAEMPLDLQARLLRVLQERTFIPLGGTEPVSADVRLLAATNKALRDEVERGRFREDLMYRVRVVPLFLPRLADREGDVEALTWHFVDELNQRGRRWVEAIARSAMEAMSAYSWPGNVRELRNNLEYAFAVGRGTVLKLEELTPELRGEPPPIRAGRDRPMTAEDLERERLLEALRATGGRKGEAAKRLGISRSTLWRKLKTHRIT